MTNDDYLAFAKRRFVIDCPEITLTQNIEDSPRHFSGPGLIYQNENGQLLLKLFAAQKPDFEAEWERLNSQRRTVPGQVVPFNQYYDLQAQKLGDEAWTSARVLIDSSTDFDKVIVTADLWRIVSKNPFPVCKDGSRLTFRIVDQLSYPANSQTIQTVKFGNKVDQMQSQVNVAEFGAANLQLRLYPDQGWTILEVEAKSAISPALTPRLIEALSFVLARRVCWAASELTTQDGTTTTLCSLVRASSETRILPPLAFKHVPEGAAHVWRMFERYLTKISENCDHSTHPLSRQVYSVLAAGEASIEAEALALGVAVEGVLKVAFPEKGNRKKGWAYKKLKQLAQQGVVNLDSVNAWKSRRDDSAHGNDIDLDSVETLQALLVQCRQCLDLFYKIIFLAIGYEGICTAYARPGWPTEEYRGAAGH